MPQVRPELVFLSGPQKGLRSAILTDQATIGRQASCEIVLKDEFASRQQAKFELTADGWIVENLSSNGSKVNGKKYKTGKQILLATGDILAVGMQTEILFVAPGDDVDAALAQYFSLHPELQEATPVAPDTEVPVLALVQMPPPARPGRGEAAPVAAMTPLPVPVLGPASEPEEMTAEQADQLEMKKRSAKFKKYAIFGCIYGAVLIGFIILMVTVRSDDEGGDKQYQPRMLKKEEIEKAVAYEPQRARNAVKAADELQKAKEEYNSREQTLGKLYRVVKYFNAYRAHRDASEADPTTLAQYEQAKRELLANVTSKYEDAYMYEQGKNWAQARRIFDELLEMVPEHEAGNPALEIFVKNVMDHQGYINWVTRKKT